jgi:hypothetical protein
MWAKRGYYFNFCGIGPPVFGRFFARAQDGKKGRVPSSMLACTSRQNHCWGVEFKRHKLDSVVSSAIFEEVYACTLLTLTLFGQATSSNLSRSSWGIDRCREKCSGTSWKAVATLFLALLMKAPVSLNIVSNEIGILREYKKLFL